MSNCGCPAGAHIADLEVSGECKEGMGQIQKVIFQRIYKAPGEKNTIAKEEMATKATLTALFSAADNSKMVITPYIENPTSTPGDARKYGGGNQTLGGVEKIIGRNPTTFTCVLNEESQLLISQLKQIACEKSLCVWLVDEFGNIGALADDLKSPTKYMGIPIRSMFVGDKKFGGFEEPDNNSMEWAFLPNWSDKFVIINTSTFDYNPLEDLVNEASE